MHGNRRCGRLVEPHENDEASLVNVITGRHEYNKKTNNAREPIRRHSKPRKVN